jgi:midasin
MGKRKTEGILTRWTKSRSKRTRAEDGDGEGKDKEDLNQPKDKEEQGEENKPAEDPEQQDDDLAKKAHEDEKAEQNEQEDDEEGARQLPQGTRDERGGTAAQVDEEEDEPRADRQSSSEVMQQREQDAPGGDDDVDEISQRWMRAMQRPPKPQEAGKDEKERKKEEARRKQEKLNPFRSLGDAMKEWKERLKMIEEKKDAGEAQEEEEAKEGGKEGEDKDVEEMMVDDEMKGDEGDEFEFVKENEKADAQTLAAAEEDEEQKLKRQEEGMDEEEAKEKEKEEGEDDAPEEYDGREEEAMGERKEDEEDQKKQGRKEMPPSMKPVVDDEKRKEKKIRDDKKKEEEGKEGKGDKKADREEEELRDKLLNEADSISKQKRETDAMEEEEEEEVRIMSMDEVARMKEDMESAQQTRMQTMDTEDRMRAEKLWREYENAVGGLAQELCEQLRLILEPTLCSQMKGDYRTGKRLNMKKVIPYIASQFKKDKIWMRRTKPSKRVYQVMLAIDDSRSMQENGSGAMACEALTLMAIALSKLEVGELSIARFGERTDLLHPFETPFTDQAGISTVSQFSFAQDSTNMVALLEKTVGIFDVAKNARTQTSTSSSAMDNLQLLFIVSDGRFGANAKEVKKWIREATKRNVFIVFIIMDNVSSTSTTTTNDGTTKKTVNPTSILDVERITWRGGKPVRKSYMDSFPFPNYIIIQNIRNLPSILADALRQWFELLQQKLS